MGGIEPTFELNGEPVELLCLFFRGGIELIWHFSV